MHFMTDTFKRFDDNQFRWFLTSNPASRGRLLLGLETRLSSDPVFTGGQQEIPIEYQSLYDYIDYGERKKTGTESIVLF